MSAFSPNLEGMKENGDCIVERGNCGVAWQKFYREAESAAGRDSKQSLVLESADEETGTLFWMAKVLFLVWMSVHGNEEDADKYVILQFNECIRDAADV